MADSGYKFEPTWQALQTAVALTTGGTIESISDPIPMSGYAAVEIAITAVYSDHARATAGLTVNVLRDSNAAYEEGADGPWGFEMPFTQNSTRRRTIIFGPGSNFRVRLHWGNTTGSSVATVTTSYKRATIPAATT